MSIARYSLDSLDEWGLYRPRGIKKCLLAIIERLPPGWLGRRLALILRKPIKRGEQLYYDRTIWGLRLRLRSKGNLSELRWLSMQKFHDCMEREALKTMFQPNSVFLDVGANVGFYTFWALSNLQEGMRIISVEPSEEILASVRYNLALNEAEDAVDIHACALTDKVGDVYLTLDKSNLGETAVSASGNGHMVRGMPLYDLVQNASVERIDAMKIDVEGYEIAVMSAFFEAAPEVLWPRMIVGEIIGEDGDAFTELLAKQGYSILSKTKMNGIFILS